MKSTAAALAAVPQLEMSVEDPDQALKEREAEGDEQAGITERLILACKAVARELTTDYCANEIDFIYGDRGRPVSAAVLRAALNDSRGNYFRVEWAIWFARQDGGEKVAEILREALGGPVKKPEEELADLHSVLRAEYPRQAERLIRKGKASR